MKTVIEMAREAGFNCLLPDEAMDMIGGVFEGDNNITKALERFAALVREDERAKQQEPEIAPDGRVAKNVFTLEDVQKASDMGREAGIAEAEALATQQEPVAWALSHSLGVEFSSKYPMQTTKEAAEQMAREHMGNVVVTPLYAAPHPVRTKDLTDDEIKQIVNDCTSDDHGYDIWCDGDSVARAVIAKFKEKQL